MKKLTDICGYTWNSLLTSVEDSIYLSVKNLDGPVHRIVTDCVWHSVFQSIKIVINEKADELRYEQKRLTRAK